MEQIIDMDKNLNGARVFLFLQGPHGPFFLQLARMLELAGYSCWRVGFNAADKVFWRPQNRFIGFKGPQDEWAETFGNLVTDKKITDLVLYGDTRDIHQIAISESRDRNITVHVFEEGYLRPYWVTYERGGSNGNSRLMKMPLKKMQEDLTTCDLEAPLPPSHWGDTRHHVFYGAIYHWFIMFANHAFPNFKPHRDLTVSQEFKLHLRRLCLLPLHAIKRRQATSRIHRGGFPYHLVLLQLEHDSSLQSHSSFQKNSQFLEEVVEKFSQGAPCHHHLVIKAHPLEDGRAEICQTLNRLGKVYQISDRIHYVRGGKLANLLDQARSAVTINSTAAQQVLWRGLPLKIFGKAVYDKPEFVSHADLAEFFAEPTRPDARGYRDFRRFLLETSQVSGGYYSRKARQQLLRRVVDMMLAHYDPYDTLHRRKLNKRSEFQSAILSEVGR